MGALLREAMNDRGGDLVFQNAGEWKELTWVLLPWM